MTASVFNRLFLEAKAAGFNTKPLYVTEREAMLLAREIIDQLRPIGISDRGVGAMLRVIMSNEALIFGQPLRIKPEERKQEDHRP